MMSSSFPPPNSSILLSCSMKNSKLLAQNCSRHSLMMTHSSSLGFSILLRQRIFKMFILTLRSEGYFFWSHCLMRQLSMKRVRVNVSSEMIFILLKAFISNLLNRLSSFSCSRRESPTKKQRTKMSIQFLKQLECKSLSQILLVHPTISGSTIYTDISLLCLQIYYESSYTRRQAFACISSFWAISGLLVFMAAVEITNTMEDISSEKMECLSSSTLLSLTRKCSSIVLTWLLSSLRVYSNWCLLERMIDDIVQVLLSVIMSFIIKCYGYQNYASFRVTKETIGQKVFHVMIQSVNYLINSVLSGINTSFMFSTLRFCFAAKKLIFGQQCSQVITSTAQEIAKVAGITLGPMGRNVLIENDKHQPRLTKDGVTVVKHLEYEDRLQDAVCTLIKKSVNSTNRFAGDGTTTSTLLIGSLLKEARKFLEAGFSPKQIKEGLKIGRDLGHEFLKMAAQPVTTKEEFYKVAMIATKGDELLSGLISEAVVKSQLIKVEKAERTESHVEYFSGVKMVVGIPHPQFKNVGDKVQLNYPLVLLDKRGIDKIEEIVEVLQIAKKARKQLLIVSTKISQSVMSTLIYNKMKKIVEVYPAVLHEYGTITQDYFKQLNITTGAVIFDRYGPCDIKEIKYEHLGRAVRVEMDQIETIVYGKAGPECTNAVIYAGGSTEAITLEIYDKVVDALNSVKTAKKHGIVAGGGVTFWRMAEMLDHYDGPNSIGVKILAKALREPRQALVRNIPDYYMALKGQGWQGYNFKNGKIEDMLEVGIVDSAAVGESVLLDSVSLAQMLIDIQVSVMRVDPNISSEAEVAAVEQKYRI